MERRAGTWAKKACWRKDTRQEGGKEGRRDEIYSKSETWPGGWRRAFGINQSARGVFGKGVREVALRLSVPEPEAT